MMVISDIKIFKQFLVIFLLSYIFWINEAKITDDEIVTITNIEAVSNGEAHLPCDITPPIQGDKVYLVIWYKEGASSPIYSLDSRGKEYREASHWSDKILENRASFEIHDDPANLLIRKLRDEDTGIYKCRVDFKKSPTRNTKVNLTVIIPPEQLLIVDETGQHIPHYHVGPYNEGSSVNITCIATGGRPTPSVKWYKELQLVDETYEILSDNKVRNVLHIEKLERHHLDSQYYCQASNTNLKEPISSTITLDLNLRPLSARIIGDNKPLSADTEAKLECEVIGSKPPPVITWWKGSTPLQNTREVTDPDGNRTVSTLTFIPTVDDFGKYLVCRGAHESIPSSGKEDGRVLNIQYVPIVTLELGGNLNGSVIKEGLDVYFECNIKSNPWIYKIKWKHNGKILYSNPSAGIIVSNQSLVLQGVTRARSGNYSCIGSNQEGDGESNQVYLDVKFAPICRPGQPKTFGVARLEGVRVPCEVEANPTDVVFTWKFNQSDVLADIPLSLTLTERLSDGAKGINLYTPKTENDYGTLLCWGRNEIGVQSEPCMYYINPAGKPDSPTNCTILNQTQTSLNVECIEGFDGGLPQTFVMEVSNSQNNRRSNVSNKHQPIFIINGLEPGLEYDITVFAVNKKGQSEPTRLQALTLKAAERHTDTLPSPPENCTVTIHTPTTIGVSCMAPKIIFEEFPVYILQAFDLKTTIFLGTDTSMDPERLYIDNLAPELQTDGRLLLKIRTRTSKATSQATTLETGDKNEVNQFLGASTPVFLQMTPILGALIGVVSALVLVAIIIVIVIRLRHGPDADDKDFDEIGLSSSSSRGVGQGSDKGSIKPLNKDLNDSVDSLEEKNPDIIPQNNGDDEYQDEERAFERLNNVSIRTYTHVNSPNNPMRNNYDTYKSQKSEEITYAELSLPQQQIPHIIYNQQPIPMTLLRRPVEPCVYAQIDVSGSGRHPGMPQGAQSIQLQPLRPPHPSQMMGRHIQTTFLPPNIRPNIPQQVMQHHEEHNDASAETPLISQVQCAGFH